MTQTLSPPRELAIEPNPPRSARSESHAFDLAACLLALPLLVLVRHVWAAQLCLLLELTIVPGALLLRALRLPAASVRQFPIYIPCASLVTLMVTGLAVDAIGRSVGFPHPLRLGPLLIGLELVCVVLWLTGWRSRERKPASPTIEVRQLWPLVLPAAAAIGAVRLSDHQSPLVAALAVGAVGTVVLVTTILAPRLTTTQLALVVYGASLAMAWSFALRGPFLYGFDISSEYHIATNTYAAGVWHSSHRADAYGAMLSLTILPTMLHAVSGISILALLKVVYPALLALFPTGVFLLASRALDRRYAFLAAAFVLTQNYFFQSLPAVGRQEIALVIFVALIGCVLDRTLPRRSQLALTALLSAGVVVSHYTSTYSAAAMMGLAIVLQLLVSLFREIPRIAAPMIVAFACLAAGAVLWYVPVTHSTSNVTSFVNSIQRRGLDLLPNARSETSLLQSYLVNGMTRLPARQYESLAAQEYSRTRPYVHPLPGAADRRYALDDAVIEPSRPIAARLASNLGTGQVVLGQIANLLALIGLIALAVRRNTGPMLRRLAFIGIGTLIFLALVRLSGTVSAAYNPERAFIQTLVLLSPAMAWVLQSLARRFAILSSPLTLAAPLALLIIFVSTSGLRGAVLGGGAPTNLAHAGEDYERFYVTLPELAAARWLTRAPNGSLVYTDRYGLLRILAATNRSTGLLPDITPRTLAQHAWVYASRSNVVLGHTRGEIADHFALYDWPSFIADRFNLVYSNGSAAVYH